MNITKIIKWRAIYAMALFPVLLASCSDDDEVKTDDDTTDVENYSIVGEWLENKSTEDQIALATYDYKENGSAQIWTAIINNTDYLNITDDVTYNLNGTSLTQKYQSAIDGSNATDKFDVLYMDYYTIITLYPNSGDIATLVKIIDTYTMIPDEKRKFSIDDSDFKCYEYNSTDENIATVDASGNITAKKRGTAFITAKSTIGDAVIRVMVEDDDNLVEDFLRWMGKDIYEASDYYGKIYIDMLVTGTDNIYDRRHTILDDYIEYIYFTYNLRKVRMVELIFRNDIDLNIIADFFDGKYENKSSDKSLREYYVDYDDVQYYLGLDLDYGYMLYVPNSLY